MKPKVTIKYNLYIPHHWQLPHLLATPVGGTVLIVEQCEEQPPGAKSVVHDELKDLWALVSQDIEVDGRINLDLAECQDDRFNVTPWFKCPLGPIGTVLACKEAIYWNNEHANYYFASDHQGVGNDRYRSLCKRLAEVAKVAKTVDAERLPIEMCRLFLRTTAIDLRRVDSMTEREALAWGCPQQVCAYLWSEQLKCSIPTPCGVHPLLQARINFENDNPGAVWGDWAWFITAEMTDRC